MDNLFSPISSGNDPRCHIPAADSRFSYHRHFPVPFPLYTGIPRCDVLIIRRLWLAILLFRPRKRIQLNHHMGCLMGSDAEDRIILPSNSAASRTCEGILFSPQLYFPGGRFSPLTQTCLVSLSSPPSILMIQYSNVQGRRKSSSGRAFRPRLEL